MPRRFLPAAALILPLLASACVGAGRGGDPADRYTINRVSLLEVATGNNEMTRGVNRNPSPGAIERTIRANPGLDEALRRQNIDLRRVGAIRVRPDGIVDVFDNGER